MFQEIPVSHLQVSELNVRKNNVGDIDSLASNIKELAVKFKSDGLIHPLTVRKSGKKYDIVAGQRRFLAIEKINEEDALIDKVKCLVITGKKDKDLLISLSENMFSQTMDPIDRYNTYSLMIKKGYSVGKIALAFNTSSLKVNQALAIADLHDDVITIYREGKIDDDVLPHMTNLSHEQQLKIVNAIENEDARFHWPRNVDEYLQRVQINVETALFDLADSGLVVETDLFQEEKYITDESRFLELQREAVKKLIEADEEKGFSTLFFDVTDNFDRWKYSSVNDDKVDPKTTTRVYDMSSSGEVDIYNKIIPKAKSKKAGSADDATTESDKPKRQELSKNDQLYFRDWKHTMACDALIKNQDYAVRFLIAKVVAKLNFSYENTYSNNETEDDQLIKSSINKNVVKFLKKINKICPEINASGYGSMSFEEVLPLVMKLKENQFKELMVALAICSLNPASKNVTTIALDLNINPLDHWQADAGFVNHLSSNPALIAVANELIKSDVEKEAFSKLKIKDKKAKLAESLTPEFLPKYLDFPVANYTGVTLDLENPSNWC